MLILYAIIIITFNFILLINKIVLFGFTVLSILNILFFMILHKVFLEDNNKINDLSRILVLLITSILLGGIYILFTSEYSYKISEGKLGFIYVIIPLISFYLSKVLVKCIFNKKINLILNKYESRKRKIDKECLDNLNSIKGSTQGIKFTKYSVTHPIDNYDHEKDVILYDDNINKYNEKDFIFEGDNEEKVEYFEQLESHLNQPFEVDDVIDLKDKLRSFYKVSKLKITCNILNDLVIDDENKFSTDDIINKKLGNNLYNKLSEKTKLLIEKQENNNLNIKNLISSEFIYDDVNEIFELRKSFKNYLESRSKDIETLMKVANRGKEGEDTVNNYLKQYDVEFTNLPNIRLEIDGNSIENDNILITRHGIFVIEVKNLSPEGKYSIEIEKNGRWLKHFPNNKQEIIDMDATKQNDRHIAYLNKFINRELGRGVDDYIHVNGVVAIANDKIDIDDKSDQHVYRFTGIYRHIIKHPIIFTQKEMEKIEKIILANNLPPKKYPMVDFIKEIDHNVLYFDRKTRDIDVDYLNNVKNILDLYKDKIESLNEEIEKDLSDIV